MEFRDRIKELRLIKNMNTTQLAAVFGKSDTAIRMWETGKSKPDADTLIKVAKYFGCSVDYLLGLSNQSTAESFGEFVDSFNELAAKLEAVKDGSDIAFSLRRILAAASEKEVGFLDFTLRSISLSLVTAVEAVSGFKQKRSDEIVNAYLDMVQQLSKHKVDALAGVELIFSNLLSTASKSATMCFDEEDTGDLQLLLKLHRITAKEIEAPNAMKMTQRVEGEGK